MAMPPEECGAGEDTLNAARGLTVRLEDVSFAYKAGETVLDKVNFTAAPGEIVAVIGPSGGGKTPLWQLIPRFYDVTEGAVLIDGHDVRKITQHSLRQNIGIVQQEVFLFADSVLENIRYGRPDATDEEVVWAARQAEIHEDILAMPNGYETYVGERGVMLSGGQKQRISIARVFLKNPPIVILDEATSMLDPEGRLELIRTVREVKERYGLTVISITHDLEEVSLSDRVILFEKGKATLDVTPRELFSRDDLEKIGLEEPFANQLRSMLHQKGFPVGETYQTEGELEKRLWELL